MKHPFILALGLIAALGACGPSTTTSTGATRLGQSPALSGGSYTTGGGITIASELRQINGMTGICGAWSESEAQQIFTKGSASDVLASASIFVGGQKLLQNLQFMRKVVPTADYSGVEANCVTTRRPWQPGDEARKPQVRIPQQKVYTERRGGTVVVLFNPTGPGASNRARATYGIDIADTENATLSRTATLTGGRYSSGGGITIAGAYQDIDGITHVCGIWSESKEQAAQTVGKAAQVLASGSVSLGGRVVVKDLRFMQKSKRSMGLGRKVARCTSTGLPWVPGYAALPLAVSIPRQVVSQNQGRAIYFEPTGPGA
jgi:hypothetical protein